MSFGLEVFDENRDSIISVGSKYLKIVGHYYIGQEQTRNLRTYFELPSSVPTDEIAFITVDLDNPPLYYTLSGRTVSLYHRSSGQGNSTIRLPAAIYYGYYA